MFPADRSPEYALYMLLVNLFNGSYVHVCVCVCIGVCSVHATAFALPL